jgi:L-histidine N-alpha-methyltransferase
LPEYYLTRAEHALLERYAEDIVARVDGRVLVEIGSGMARKTGVLARAMTARWLSACYVPFDIEPEALAASARALLHDDPRLRVRGVVGDFSCDLARLSLGAPPLVGSGRLFAFLGSTIGNLDEHEAPALLREVAALMTDRDRFLLGVDLVKDERVLHAAYNDAQGITAEFNRNVLRVLSRELDGDFDPSSFDHLAFYDAARARVEMHLVSRNLQLVSLREIDLRLELRPGERILTEISRKFTPATTEQTLLEGGMSLQDWWRAQDGAFALALAKRR